MKVLLVEPLGHLGGHMSAHTKYLSEALAHTDIDATLLTFDGLLGSRHGLDAKLKHVSFISKTGIFSPVFRFLPFQHIVGTICTFLILFLLRRQRFDVIHILDCYERENSFPMFAVIVNHYGLVLTLFATSRAVELKNLGTKFRDAFFKRQVKICLELCLIRISWTRLARAFRRYLYNRAAKRNHLAFCCYTRSVCESHSESLQFSKVVRMFHGVGIPETQSMPQIEARESLGLSLDGPLFLHFGDNHSMKCFEAIFQAFRSLPSYYKLIFAGRVNPIFQDNNPWKLASKYDCNKKTIIIDQYIPEEEMRQYFYAADAVIISHRREHRGGSGVLAPACRYGVPVIASNTDTGELGEIVDGYKLGLTFTAEDHQSLQESILSFLNLEEDKRKEIKNNFFNFALTHSWEKAAEDHVVLYQNLIRV